MNFRPQRIFGQSTGSIIGKNHELSFLVAVDPRLLKRAENTVTQTLVASLESREQLLHRFALGVLVRRAGRGDDRERVMVDKISHVLLLCIYQRAYHCEILSREVGHG